MYWNRNRSEERIRQAKTPWRELGRPAGSTETFPKPGDHTPPPPGQDRKMQFVIASQHLWFDNIKDSQQYSHKEAKDNSHGISYPKGEEKVHQITVWQISTVCLEVGTSTGLCSNQTSWMPFPMNNWLGAADCSPLAAGGGWGCMPPVHVQPSHTFLASLSHSNVVFCVAIDKSLHTLHTEIWATSLQHSTSALLNCF